MTTDVSSGGTVLPPEDLEMMSDLSRFLDRTTAPAVLVGPDGQQVPLPLEAFDVLRTVAHAMRAGKAITVAPVDQLLTTQEAADFLGVSRPTLVKLLEESEEIPFERPGAGRHRRVRLDDVLAYQERRRAERHASLDQVARDAADTATYVGSDYGDALRRARGKTA